MTNKLLIVRSEKGQPVAGGRVASELRVAKVRVEHTLRNGVITPSVGVRASTLEKKGYRVWVLENTETLSIGKYKIDITKKRPPRIPAVLSIPKTLQQRWTHHLVQMVAPPEIEWIQAVEDRGIRVVETIPPYGLFVVGTPTEVEALASLAFVAWTGPFQPAYRVSERLLKMRSGVKTVNIGALADGDVDAVRTGIKKAGGKIIVDSEKEGGADENYVTLIAELPVRAISRIARLQDVRWMDFHPESILYDERSCQILAGDLDAVAPPNTAPNVGYGATLANLGLTGAGTTISICDTGVDTHNNATMQADLAGRMAFFSDVTGGTITVDQNGHGTHVAGIAVGNGATGDTDPQNFVLGQGVAPGANFGSINGISGVVGVNMSNWTQLSVTNGADVMNNSWGTAAGGVALLNQGYTALCRTVDQLVRDPDNATGTLDSLVIVGAAGNSGNALSTLGEPWESKNTIVVGNSLNSRPGEGDIDDIRGLRSSSSRGPSVDGRISPTIIAPGTNITSSRPGPTVDSNPTMPGIQRPRTAYTDTGGTVHNNHFSISGTSMASPHVAGTCALLIEWWRNRSNGKTPSTALLKALLVNGAVDAAGGPTRRGGNIANIPNNDQGWGRVTLENMLLQAPATDRGPKIFIDQRHAFTANNQEHMSRVAAADVARPLRITLVWSDAAGAAGANPALVNNLNLEVTELNTGNVFRGNVFNNGFSTTGGAFDTRNNVECVYLENPQGTYEVRVLAQSVTQSARPDIATPWQDFALVLDNVEVPNAAPVSIVPVIDTSGSMVTYGYEAITRTSSKQFVDLMSIDDEVAVVSFGSTGVVEYPTGASPALQTITGQVTRDAANARIDAINFGGCTFMGDGIEKAASLLSGAPAGQRAMVLLSDGYDNKGCDRNNVSKPSALDAAAALPNGLPIYSCAMGPNSDQVLLEQLATDTDGLYYYMPTIDDLFEIYNYIRGQVSGDSIIINDTNTASSSRVSGYVDGCARSVTFSVAWFDASLKYVSRDPKKSKEISIRLRDPKGRLLHNNAADVFRIVGEGYAIFKIDEPMPGRWYVEVETARSGHTRYTVGGFVDSPLKLILPATPKVISVNTPLPVVAQVVHGKDPVAGFRVKASIVAPPIGVNKLLKKYARQLTRIRPNPKLAKDMPRDLAKLAVLRQKILKGAGKDILSHEVITIPMAERSNRSLRRMGLDRLASAPVIDTSAMSPALTSIVSRPVTTRLAPISVNLAYPLTPRLGSGLSVGRLAKAPEAGTYNVLVKASGFAPGCSTRFTRLQMTSVLVK